MMNFNAIVLTPYQIVEYLLKYGNQNFWRLLYYNDIYALDRDVHPNDITLELKTDMIWSGLKLEQCNIFFTKLVEDYIPLSKVIMKIFSNQINPVNTYTANVLWAIEFLWGGEMSIVYDANGLLCNRGDLLLYYFMDCINGKLIGSCGRITFDYGHNRFDCVKTIYGNEQSYTGIALYISLAIGSEGLNSSDCQDIIEKDV